MTPRTSSGADLPLETPAPVFILIDGHNLAHHLFHLKTGQHLTSDLAGQLVEHLNRYRQSFKPPAAFFEILFDGGVLPEMQDPPGIRVMAAGPQNKADQIILERFRFHAHQNEACLAISNDLEIIEKIQEEGGAALLAHHFVRLASPRHPIFLDPADLLAELPKPRRWVQPPAEEPQLARRQPQPLKPAQPRPRKTPGVTEKPSPSVQIEPPVEVSLPPMMQPAENTVPIFPVETHRYRLTIRQWPVTEGLRFLKDSVCDQHRAQFLANLEGFTAEELRAADLEDLAKMLVASCGAEAGFACRGSLMDRVRLALLSAGEAGLGLRDLAAAAGLPIEGLHRAIKRKAGGWLAIDR